MIQIAKNAKKALTDTAKCAILQPSKGMTPETKQNKRKGIIQ